MSVSVELSGAPGSSRCGALLLEDRDGGGDGPAQLHLLNVFFALRDCVMNSMSWSAKMSSVESTERARFVKVRRAASGGRAREALASATHGTQHRIFRRIVSNLRPLVLFPNILLLEE